MDYTPEYICSFIARHKRSNPDYSQSVVSRRVGTVLHALHGAVKAQHDACMRTSCCGARARPLIRLPHVLVHTRSCFTTKHRPISKLPISLLFFLLLEYYLIKSPLLSSSTQSRFSPQRSSGQAVVTRVVPSPRHMPSFLSRIGFSIPTARRFSSNVANSRSSRAFR